MAALLVSSILVGCASTHREVDVDQSTLEARPALDCRIQVAELVDSVGERTFVGAGGDTWVISGISDGIREQIDEWQPDAPGAERAIELNLELVRAYSEPKTTQVYFHTVLLAGEEQSEKQIFRGAYDVTNWFGSQAEFMRAVQRSLDDALGKLHGWLSERCAQA